MAEGYFSQLKRSLDGTYHHVSVEHLPRYLAEFEYRYSTCKMSDGWANESLGPTNGREIDPAASNRMSLRFTLVPHYPMDRPRRGAPYLGNDRPIASQVIYPLHLDLN